MENEIEVALQEAYSELQEIGNGYGWTVEVVTEKIFPVIQANVPSFDPSKVDLSFIEEE